MRSLNKKLESKMKEILKISVIPINTNEYKFPYKIYFSDYIHKIHS